MKDINGRPIAVAVCTPHGGAAHPDYYRHILEMENNSRHMQYYQIEVDTMIVGKARNMLLEQGLVGTPADVFLFVDDDVLVPANTYVLAEQAMDLGIVSGVYFSRRSPFTPQAYVKAYEPGLEGMYWPLLEYADHGMTVVDAVGGGLLAVRRDVVVRLRDYWTEKRARLNTKVRERLGDDTNDFDWLMQYVMGLSPWFEFLDKKGEDLYFCERAKEAGYVIWLCTDVKAPHVGEMVFEEHHFKYLRDNHLIVKTPVGTPAAIPDKATVVGSGAPGAEDKHADNHFAYPRPEAVEWRDNLPRAPRRIGISSNISRSIPST